MAHNLMYDIGFFQEHVASCNKTQAHVRRARPRGDSNKSVRERMRSGGHAVGQQHEGSRRAPPSTGFLNHFTLPSFRNINAVINRWESVSYFTSGRHRGISGWSQVACLYGLPLGTRSGTRGVLLWSFIQVWFRQGYLGLGRLVTVNDLVGISHKGVGWSPTVPTFGGFYQSESTLRIFSLYQVQVGLHSHVPYHQV